MHTAARYEALRLVTVRIEKYSKQCHPFNKVKYQ